MEENNTDTPITTGTIVKWSAIIGGAISAIISISLYLGSINQSIALIRQRADQQQTAIDDVTKIVKQQGDDQRKIERDVAGLNAKLDVAITVLNRIDVKVGKP